MAEIAVTFYEQFHKQPNSTFRPTQLVPAHPSRTFDCIMWDGVSFLAPVVELALFSGSGTFDNPAALGMTYAYIPSFERYYWVLDWRLSEGRWIATMQVDVLASFKEDIGNASLFADRLGDRLGYGYPILTPLVPIDTGLPDNAIPTVSRPWIHSGAIGLPWMRSSFWSGTYVLGVINADISAVGAISYYAMTRHEFREFMGAMLSGTYFGTNADISTETTKAILNPMQYVATCNWFPLKYEDVVGNSEAQTDLHLGWWTLHNVDHKNINITGLVHKLFCTKLDKHPYADELNLSMLNYLPYTQYQIQIPYFGSVQIYREDFQSGELTCHFTYDLVSGLAQVRLYDRFPYGYDYATDGDFPDYDDFDTGIIGHCNLIRTLSAQASAPIQIAQTTSDYGAARVTQIQANATAAANSAMLQRSYATAVSNSITSAIGAVGSLLIGNIGGMISGVTSAINSYNESQYIKKYTGAAVAAQNQAARASGAYTSALQRAPKVETTGNNGSVLESYFPLEIKAEFLIPSTIDNHQYEWHEPNGDVTDTRALLEWIGYAHGKTIKINEHTGYIQGHDPMFFSYKALAPEVDQIKQYMQEGFFYE